MSAELTEAFYTVKEVAERWKVSPNTVRRAFDGKPGVLRFGKQAKGKRRYQTIRISAGALRTVEQERQK